MENPIFLEAFMINMKCFPKILTQVVHVKFTIYGTPKMHLFNEKKFKLEMVISFFFHIDEFYNNDFY